MTVGDRDPVTVRRVDQLEQNKTPTIVISDKLGQVESLGAHQHNSMDSLTFTKEAVPSASALVDNDGELMEPTTGRLLNAN